MIIAYNTKDALSQHLLHYTEIPAPRNAGRGFLIFTPYLLL